MRGDPEVAGDAGVAGCAGGAGAAAGLGDDSFCAGADAGSGVAGAASEGAAGAGSGLDWPVDGVWVDAGATWAVGAACAGVCALAVTRTHVAAANRTTGTSSATASVRRLAVKAWRNAPSLNRRSIRCERFEERAIATPIWVRRGAAANSRRICA